MIVSDCYRRSGETAFSFEILPPLRGNSINRVYSIIDKLREFEPVGINITSHHSECVYIPQPDGSHRKTTIRRRPGTVAIASAIQNKYGIPAVPHIICKGFSKDETEYALLDLNFLGIQNLLLLRGDSKSADTITQNPETYHQYATDLQAQINDFNQGIALDGTKLESIETPFSYGMACYPEKHEEAPNMEIDLHYAKMKADAGAGYLVTQMFFDNQKYYDFVARCREAGITIPIVAGIKPITKMRQMTLLPKTFHVDLPEPLAAELRKAKCDEDVIAVGREWAVEQCRDLIAHGAPGLHFYTLMASDSVRSICNQIF